MDLGSQEGVSREIEVTDACLTVTVFSSDRVPHLAVGLQSLLEARVALKLGG
jgi:hypothetical protein